MQYHTLKRLLGPISADFFADIPRVAIGVEGGVTIVQQELMDLNFMIGSVEMSKKTGTPILGYVDITLMKSVLPVHEESEKLLLKKQKAAADPFEII